MADLLIGGLDAQFKKAQIKLLPPKLKNSMHQDSRVVVNDEIIKLHANDRREEYGGKYKKIIAEMTRIKEMDSPRILRGGNDKGAGRK